MKKFVIDSCVFAKLFLLEEDREIVLKLFDDLARKDDIKIYVPSIFIYEIVNISCRQNLETKKILQLITQYKKHGLSVLELDDDLLFKAAKLAQNGSSKSGYPSLYDCSYHALAIAEKCTFITSDIKHYQKTKKFGHIKLLKDYE